MTKCQELSVSCLPNLVSVCHRRDLWIWRYSQHLIPLNLKTKSYTLIVDDCDLPIFRLLTTSLFWEVKPASSIISIDFLHALKFTLNQARSSLNVGWYWQQFLKIQFILNQDPGICVIWDADTIPLHSISFPLASVGFFQPSTEHHAPYWLFNKSVLGSEFGAYPGFSFISQFFGIESNVVREMAASICKYTSLQDWKDASLRSILNVHSHHRMSEYELIGSYAYNFFSSNEFVKMSLSWTREGASRTSSPIQPLIKDLLSSDFDYAAFERRDMFEWTVTKDRALRLLSFLLSKASHALPKIQ